MLLFGIAAAVAGAFASSLVPALGATRVAGIALRRDAGRASASRSNRRLRLGLVAGQLAVSVVLLVGAGVFLRVLHGYAVLDLGYRTEGALTFRPRFMKPQSSAQQDADYASLYSQLSVIPGVISVAAVISRRRGRAASSASPSKAAQSRTGVSLTCVTRLPRTTTSPR